MNLSRIQIIFKAGLTLFIAAWSSVLFAQPYLDWGKSIGGPNGDNLIARTTSSGGVVFGGTFYGTADLDPGPTVSNFTSYSNSYDIFFGMLDPQGNLLWVQRLGGNYDNKLSDIVIDSVGNIYIYGSTSYSMDFDPSPTFHTMSDGIYVAKYDPTGSYIWSKLMPHTSFSYLQSPSKLAIGTDGSLCMIGRFDGTTDFDPSATNYPVTAAGLGQDIYLLKLSANGDFVWVRQMILSLNVVSNLFVDKGNNIYVTTHFNGTCNFDYPNQSETAISNGLQDGYMTKYDQDGNFLFDLQIGGDENDYIFSVSVTDNFDIVVGGAFSDTVDFDLGVDIVEKTTDSATTPAFLACYSSAGALLWVESMESTSSSSFNQVLTTQNGTIVAAGGLVGSADFDPGPNTHSVTSSGNSDVFIGKYSATGDFVWGTSIGSDGSEQLRAISIDDNGDILFSGLFNSDTLVLNNSTNDTLFSAGGNDGVILKYINCRDSSSTSLTACDSFSWNGQVLDTSGIYFQTLYTSLGCDNIVELDLTILHSTSSSTTLEACDSLEWHGTTYLISGTYFDTLTNQAGCDSVILLDLTIHHSYFNSQDITACDFYNWNGQEYIASGIYTDSLITINGCDSVLELHLTILNSTSSTTPETVCDSLEWHGTTYFNSGLYSDTLQNDAGCDSVAWLNLTVHHSFTGTETTTACQTYEWNGNVYSTSGNYTATFQTVDGCDSIRILNLTVIHPNVGVTQNGPQLTAIENGAGYQWLSCNPFASLDNETSQQFTATTNGEYAVIVTQAGCADTSSCYEVSGIGLNEIALLNQILVTPNPTNGLVTISLTEGVFDESATLKNSLGQAIGVFRIITNEMQLDLSGLSTGIYYLEVWIDGQPGMVRILRE